MQFPLLCDVAYDRGLAVPLYNPNRLLYMLSNKATERFLSSFEIDIRSGCWFWTKHLTWHGYGRFWTDNREWPAHRYSMLLFKGEYHEFPKLIIDHKCRNKNCVNPDHLHYVSYEENMKNMVRRSHYSTTCRRGHPYNEKKNARTYPNGYRYCRACHNLRQRKYYHESKNAQHRS